MILLTMEDHSIPLVAIRVCYHVGIKNECPGLTGITSICEAAGWQGTRLFKKGEISRIIQAGGGYTTSFTDWDVSCFYTKVPSGMLDTVLVLESDRMSGIDITAERLLLAKDIVRKKRLAEVESSIYGHINEEFFSLAYRSHPYGHNIYGWPDDIDRINLDDLKQYMRANFQPSNAMIVIAGDFDSESVTARVRQLFGGLYSEPPERWRPIAETKSLGDRLSVIEANVGIPVFIMGYHIPGIAHEDIPVLRLINNILNTGTSSRIYRRMVTEEKSAMVISGGIINAEDPGLIYNYAILNFDSPVEEGIRQMEDEIRRIKIDHITDAELEKAKNRALVDFYMSERTLEDKTVTAATSCLLTGDSDFREKMITKIKSVTRDDILHTAQKYFSPSNRIVVIVRPPGDVTDLDDDYDVE
ncbi:MAG: pitrilysin family protein [Candidatus Zixiibacteriota bacterium]